MLLDIEKVQHAVERLGELDREFQEMKELLHLISSVKENKNPVMSTKDVRKALQCGQNTAYKVMDEVGKIIISNKNYIKIEDFERYMESRKHSSTTTESVNYELRRKIS